MNEALTGQVTGSAADVYDEFFVPALFRQWAPVVADAAGVNPGDHVLDVACGTGVLTREIAGRVGPDGRAVGLDCNDVMLSTAQSKSPDLEWMSASAEAIPHDNAEFDAVVSQFGLMFFEDRVTALQEMSRVVKPGGKLVVAVWDALENSAGYAAMADLLKQLFGDTVADAIRSPFVLGDTDEVTKLFDEAGIPDIQIEVTPGEACFPSIESWVHTDVKGWTLADLIDEQQYQQLQAAAAKQLSKFQQPDGSVQFPAPAHIITATKPAIR